MNLLAGTPVEETTLETERFLLEPLMPGHAPLLVKDLADERLYRFIPTDAPESAEALETRYRKLSSRGSPDGAQVWLNFAMRQREEGTLSKASYVGMLEATVFPDRSAYLAYIVFVPFWRQGYAREGCARFLRHLLDDYRVRSLWQRWTRATPLRSRWRSLWASSGSVLHWALITSRAR
jgi:[ribosomal protein S5]-alanine N-acetyltransferase